MKTRQGIKMVVVVGLGLLFVQSGWTQSSTNLLPQPQAVYGGTIGVIQAIPLPDSPNITRLFVSTDSANSVFYADADHSSSAPYDTNFAWTVVSDMDANANHGRPWWLDVHQPSARLFAACDDGLFSCTVAGNSIATNIAGQMAFVLIQGNALFAINGGVPEAAKSLYYGALNAAGALTLGAALGTQFNGTVKAAIHPVNRKLYVLENVQTNFSLYQSSSDYDAFSALTTFTPVSVPAGLGWVASQIGIGPDSRLFLGGGDVNTNLQVAFSTNDGTTWATADTGAGLAGGGIGLNIVCNGSAGAYDVYYGYAVSSNKGASGTWSQFPRGGQRIPPFSHANAGSVEVDPLNTQVIYLTTDKGLGASTNLGVDLFELNQGLLAVQINDLDLSTSKDIAWLASKAGIRRATNFSVSPVWTDGEFPNAIANCVALEPSDAGGLTAYAGSAARVYKTTTGGGTNADSWPVLFSLSQGDPGVTNGIVGNCKTIKVDGSNIYAGFFGEQQVPCSGRFCMSPDSGATWTTVATNIDVMDIIVNTESGVQAVYVAVMKANSPSGGGSDGGIYRYVPGSGITRDLTNAVDIHNLALDAAGGIAACGAEQNTIAESDPNRYHVALFYKEAGAVEWFSVPRSGLPVDLGDSEITGADRGPVITVGRDSSSNEIPILAVVRTLYYLPEGGTNWVSLYTYPNGTQIKMLYWDELLVGTSIGLYGQGISAQPLLMATAGDFDGDGVSDLAVVDRSSGLWCFRLSGSGYELSVYPILFGGPGYTPLAGDFDGDRLADMVAIENATGIWLFRLSGNGYNLTVFDLPFGGADYIPLIGDFDGDGLSDMAVVDGSGIWYFRLSGGGYGNLTAFALPFGGPGYLPLTGDFDGDHLADMVVVDSASGFWFFRKSTEGYGTLGYYGLPFGGPDYTPLTGDFDGDRLADMVVVDDASGFWFFRKSTEGYGTLGYYGLPFGGPGYSPVK